MKKNLLLFAFILLALPEFLAAQPLLQLLPRTVYKETVKFTNDDWAGFYRTSQYDEIGPSLMLLVPAGDSIVGYCISENLQYIRILKGALKGNGIRYKYTTIDFENKMKVDIPEGEGFMVMKDDGSKENVYCKHGDAKGMREAKGCFSAGKKKQIELHNGYRAADFDWSGDWTMDAKYENALMKLDKSGDGYIGFYTLKNFKKSETSSSNWAFNMTKTTKTTWTFPKSTVLVMGIPYGDCLYFLELHKDGERLGAGILTMSQDKNSFSGPHVENEKVKNLSEKSGAMLKGRR